MARVVKTNISGLILLCPKILRGFSTESRKWQSTRKLEQIHVYITTQVYLSGCKNDAQHKEKKREGCATCDLNKISHYLKARKHRTTRGFLNSG